MTEGKRYHNISGVILAGGTGKRLNGIIKAKLVIHGKSIISMIIDTMNQLFDEIIIVTNTPEEFTEYDNFKIVGDQFINKGPIGGIHSAMRIASCKAMFVVAGDMPLLEKDVIIRQIDYFNHNNFSAVIPRVTHFIEPLHGIYKKSLLKDLEDYLETSSNYSIMTFLKITNTGYLLFDETDKTRRAFMNINSPNDLAIVEKLMDSAL